MKPRLLIGAEVSSGRVMQWLSSLPCGRSLPARKEAYDASCPMPTCSVRPTELIASKPVSTTSR